MTKLMNAPEMGVDGALNFIRGCFQTIKTMREMEAADPAWAAFMARMPKQELAPFSFADVDTSEYTQFPNLALCPSFEFPVTEAGLRDALARLNFAGVADYTADSTLSALLNYRRARISYGYGLENQAFVFVRESEYMGRVYSL